MQGRFHALHNLIRQREYHFHNRPQADPRLPSPHSKDAEPFQIDTLRKTHLDMRSRLTENPYRIRVEPPQDRPSQRKPADQLEKVLQLGLEHIESRERINILKALSDGMGIHCFGVLHWQLASDLWPEVPEPRRTDALGDLNDDERNDYRETDDGIIETDESVLRRDQQNKAKAGFPFYIEVPRADQIAFVEDRSTLNGLSTVVYMRDVGMIEYRDKLSRQGIELGTVKQNASARRYAAYTERTKPDSWEPSGQNPEDWGKSITMCQVWTREEVYELIAPSERGSVMSEWVLVKSSKHGYEMPPFAIIPADEFNEPDPALRYLPYLEGIYKLKPFVDYDNTVGRLLAHQIAMPFYWIRTQDGFMMNEDGTRVVLSHNAAAAEALPPGAELVKVEMEMNPAFIEFLNRAGEMLDEAKPQSGNVDISASTQPWTLRYAEIIANVPILDYKLSLAKGIETMVQNMTLIMQKPASEGGIGEAVPVYARLRKGKVEEETLIAVDPEDIPSMQIEVDIKPQSTAQTIANEEHGRILVGDPNIPVTPLDWLKEYHGDDQADETYENWIAEETYRTSIQPIVIRGELAKRFSQLITVGPDGRFVGAGGVELSPEDVLSANGAQTAARVDPSVQAEGQSTNPLPDLNVNGATPVAGVPR